MKKIGFVTPWYGEKIPGGAEMATRELVHHLHDTGVSIEILTTCVERFASDWNTNHHKAILSQENGISVRRFKVRKRNVKEFDRVNAKLMRGEKLLSGEEQVYCEEMINSPDLYRYLKVHESEYSLFLFIPYMFGTTYYGCQMCPEKSVLIPCLHDESYAHMQCFKEAFSRVNGMVFLSEPEKKLANKLYGVEGGRFCSIGLGVDISTDVDAERFRKKYGLTSPFVLYAGRKDAGKRVDVLVRYFAEYKRRHPSDLKLVLIGGGEIELPSKDILDLGFVPVRDKYDAYAAANVFCNPSQFESFSLVIMEAWLAGTPVMVNGKCEVTKDFAVRTNGGLYYCNYPEFEECLEYLLAHRDIAENMGENGKSFVKKNFSWDVIVKRYTDYFKALGE